MAVAVSPLCSTGPPRQQSQSLQGHPEEGGAVGPSDAEEDIVAILNSQHQDCIQLAALQAARCELKSRAPRGTQTIALSPHHLTIFHQINIKSRR